MVAESPYKAYIIRCFMGLDDPEKAFTRIREVTTTGDWTPHLSDPELRQVLEKYSLRSRALGKKCLELGLPYVDASDVFLTAHEQAYSHLNPQNILATSFMK